VRYVIIRKPRPIGFCFQPEVAEDMLKFGITRVFIEHFYYQDFRYTNAKDAIAQAKRQQGLSRTAPLGVEG